MQQQTEREVFGNGRWIWTEAHPGPDDYAEFYAEFRPQAPAAPAQAGPGPAAGAGAGATGAAGTGVTGEPVICRISCDGDYTLFVNGRYAAGNQYGDFEHYKIYDELDLTPFLQPGNNRFALLVWHFGASSQRYIPAQAGVIFALTQGGRPLLVSGGRTLCRRSRAYRSGGCRILTRQLGFSFAYDATQEDDWLGGNGQGFAPAVEVEKRCALFPRPTEKLRLGAEIPARPVAAPANGADAARDIAKTVAGSDTTAARGIAKSVAGTDTDAAGAGADAAEDIAKTVAGAGADAGCPARAQVRWLLDLGAESVGLFRFCIETAAPQELRISYGEHLEDGCVRRCIGNRDFSFTYRARAGVNEYVNYMLRLGCRYLEITGEQPFVLRHAGLLPQYYPVRRVDWQPAAGPDRRIWELCLRTLELCMMEHYVDCPWREQCLFVFDARTPILPGYDGFAGGNAAYARANLLLMSRDRREDNLLSICFPCGDDLVIPSFSLYYFIAVREYFAHTGDVGLLREVFPKLQSVLSAFLSNIREGLVMRFGGVNRWNFYDWSPGLDGALRQEDGGAPDLMLNGLFLLALEAMREICAALNEPFACAATLETCRRRTRQTFLRPKEGLFALHPEGDLFLELPNALAVLAGLCRGDEAAGVCRRIAARSLTGCSLSMKTLVYDALLATDPAYRDFVLDDIRATYGAMLRAGATSAWETKEGASAFRLAGSLCHGWSAVPVHYYRRLC